VASTDTGPLRNVLGRPPSPNETDDNGWTDLHFAAALNLPELAAVLLDAGADVESELKVDGERLDEQLIQSLRQLELFSAFRRRGYTALHAAAFNDAQNAAAVLIGRGADIHATDSYGKTPLHDAAYGNALEVTKCLIDHGAGLNVKDDQHRTPLHLAVYGNALEVAAELIARGANLLATDRYGRTPRHLAEQLGRRGIMALLTNGKTI